MSLGLHKVMPSASNKRRESHRHSMDSGIGDYCDGSNDKTADGYSDVHVSVYVKNEFEAFVCGSYHSAMWAI